MSDKMMALTETALDTSEIMHPFLAGKPAAVQAAILADLVSLYFAGHNPEVREEMIAAWLQCMRILIPIGENQLRQKRGGKLPWDK